MERYIFALLKENYSYSGIEKKCKKHRIKISKVKLVTSLEIKKKTLRKKNFKQVYQVKVNFCKYFEGKKFSSKRK